MQKLHLIVLLATMVLIAGVACADEITISTYYPAPYGIYNNFEVKKSSAVGEISGSATGVTDVENLDKGELWVQDSMIFEPKASFDPASAGAGKKGELVYSSDDKVFYYYDGNSWAPLATQQYVDERTFLSKQSAACAGASVAVKWIARTCTSGASSCTTGSTAGYVDPPPDPPEPTCIYGAGLICHPDAEFICSD